MVLVGSLILYFKKWVERIVEQTNDSIITTVKSCFQNSTFEYKIPLLCLHDAVMCVNTCTIGTLTRKMNRVTWNHYLRPFWSIILIINIIHFESFGAMDNYRLSMTIYSITIYSYPCWRHPIYREYLHYGINDSRQKTSRIEYNCIRMYLYI